MADWMVTLTDCYLVDSTADLDLKKAVLKGEMSDTELE